MAKTPKHILVIRLSAMGDVAMSVPVVRALTQQYPDIKITILTRTKFTSFFRNLDNVTVFPAYLEEKHKGIYGLYKLARQLNKANQFYAIADLHNVLRSKILKKFIRGKRFVTIDKGRKEKRQLISGKIFEPLKSTHNGYAEVFEPLGYRTILTNPTFPKKAQLNKKLQNLIGQDSKKLIGIAPFAAHEGKMYPLDLMTIVIEHLSKKNKVILFGGGKNEIEFLSGLENKYDNVINAAGRLSLDEEMDLISNLNVMLSMDSGNAHIAAMLGIKVITIWGVTHPYAGFAPFNQPFDYCLIADRNEFPLIPTSVYGNKYPENYKYAARSISPDLVIDKINAVI
nr:glycosyltransferase family 9 protein [Flaviramulus sp.]